MVVALYVQKNMDLMNISNTYTVIVCMFSQCVVLSKWVKNKPSGFVSFADEIYKFDQVCILVGGLEHLFFHILGIMIPNWLIFFRGVEISKQMSIDVDSIWVITSMAMTADPQLEVPMIYVWPIYIRPMFLGILVQNMAWHMVLTDLRGWKHGRMTPNGPDFFLVGCWTTNWFHAINIAIASSNSQGTKAFLRRLSAMQRASKNQRHHQSSRKEQHIWSEHFRNKPSMNPIVSGCWAKCWPPGADEICHQGCSKAS